MRTDMLVRRINAGGKTVSTARGQKVVEAHYKGALDRMKRGSGMEREAAKREANAIAYAWNKAQGRRC